MNDPIALARLLTMPCFPAVDPGIAAYVEARLIEQGINAYMGTVAREWFVWTDASGSQVSSLIEAARLERGRGHG